jgi:hypothetical protein
VSDADTGEVLDDLRVPPGNEVVIANEPLFISGVQEHANGTKVITLKRRSALAAADDGGEATS